MHRLINAYDDAQIRGIANVLAPDVLAPDVLAKDVFAQDEPAL